MALSWNAVGTYSLHIGVSLVFSLEDFWQTARKCIPSRLMSENFFPSLVPFTLEKLLFHRVLFDKKLHFSEKEKKQFSWTMKWYTQPEFLGARKLYYCRKLRSGTILMKFKVVTRIFQMKIIALVRKVNTVLFFQHIVINHNFSLHIPETTNSSCFGRFLRKQLPKKKFSNFSANHFAFPISCRIKPTLFLSSIRFPWNYILQNTLLLLFWRKLSSPRKQLFFL